MSKRSYMTLMINSINIVGTTSPPPPKKKGGSDFSHKKRGVGKTGCCF